MKTQKISKQIKWLAVGSVLAGGLAYAQPGMPQPPAQQPHQAQPMPAQPAQPETPEITDELLVQAVTAYISVSEIQTRVQQELAGVEDQEVIQGAVTQARTDMIEAVQDAGMAPAQYEEVMNVVTQDEQVRNRFLLILQEEQQADS